VPKDAQLDLDQEIVQAIEEHLTFAISTNSGHFLQKVWNYYHVEKSNGEDQDYKPSQCTINLFARFLCIDDDPFFLQFYNKYQSPGMSCNPTPSLNCKRLDSICGQNLCKGGNFGML